MFHWILRSVLKIADAGSACRWYPCLLNLHRDQSTGSMRREGLVGGHAKKEEQVMLLLIVSGVTETKTGAPE